MTDKDATLRRRLEREIQARRQAEALLEHKSEELYNSLFQLRSALDAMAEGLLLTDQSHQVVLCNSQLRELYPHLQEDLRRERPISKQFVEFTEHPSYLKFLADQSASIAFEIALADGRVIAVNARRTRNGQIASTHQEITHRKADEREKRRLLIDLMRAQRLESIGRMAGMITHDFNNIIAAIKGYIGFLEEDVEHTAKVDESITAIAAATDKAERLIEQILEYGNRQQFSRQAVSLIPVLEDCLELAEPRFRQRIDIRASLPESPIWLDGNETRLNQLFMNILSNADRAMEGDGHRLLVSLQTHASLSLDQYVCDDWTYPITQSYSTTSGLTAFDVPCVCVSISDTGNGMEESVVNNMFEAYFSTRKSGRIGGVGLASVADIIADHAGGIRVITAPDVGTSVQLVFPLAADDPTSSRESPQIGERGPIHVLVIDDDESVGRMIKEMLSREGINADFYQSSLTAQRDLHNDPFRWQLVISDQIMPDLKGSELLQSLREASIDIPFVICSAHIDSVGNEVTQELADGLLAKPVAREALVACIEQLIYPSVLP